MVIRYRIVPIDDVWWGIEYEENESLFGLGLFSRKYWQPLAFQVHTEKECEEEIDRMIEAEERSKLKPRIYPPEGDGS